VLKHNKQNTLLGDGDRHWHMYCKQQNMARVLETTRIGTCTENGAKWYMYRNCKLRQENKLAKNTELVHVPDLKLAWRKIPKYNKTQQMLTI